MASSPRGGTLGILIPPSGPMILYGVVSDTSIGALFMAGVVPGLMLAAIFAIYCMSAARFGATVAATPRAARVVGRRLPRRCAARSGRCCCPCSCSAACISACSRRPKPPRIGALRRAVDRDARLPQFLVAGPVAVRAGCGAQHRDAVHDPCRGGDSRQRADQAADPEPDGRARADVRGVADRLPVRGDGADLRARACSSRRSRSS